MITNNFYFIDKPLNFTSFDIIRILRKKLDIKKIWHTWTLDPLASWGLLVAVWDYTKLIPYIDKLTKEYEFEISLDWVSDSFDKEKEINYISKEKQEYFKKNIKQEDIKKILQEKFLWKINQLPPKYSALKINWKKAYELANKWEEVNLKSRELEIFYIEILDYNYPKLKLKAKVSAWTYIRSIANDLWQILWTWGYISLLRRTKVWELDISESIELDDCKLENSLDIKKLFNENLFINLQENILEKINNWLIVDWKFDYIQNKDLFVINNNKITNIVIYNWEYIKPVRKI